MLCLGLGLPAASRAFCARSFVRLRHLRLRYIWQRTFGLGTSDSDTFGIGTFGIGICGSVAHVPPSASAMQARLKASTRTHRHSTQKVS